MRASIAAFLLATLAGAAHAADAGSAAARDAVVRAVGAASAATPLEELRTRLAEAAGDAAVEVAQPGPLAVTLRRKAECADETSLLVFARKGDRWELALVDAVTGVDYRWATAGPLIAAAHVDPGCAPGWRMLHWRVLKPSGNPYRPAVVAGQKESIHAGDPRPTFTLELAPGLLTLRFRTNSLDPARPHRGRVAAYALDGPRGRRVPPFAETPEDFVEEWIAMLWSQAARHANPKAGVERAYRELHEAMSYRFLDAERAEPGPDRWNLALATESLEGPGRTVIVEVGRRNGHFSIERITAKD